MAIGKYTAFFLFIATFGAFGKPACDITTVQLHDVDRGYIIYEQNDIRTLKPNPPLRCADITVTLSQRQQKVASWLNRRVKAVLTDGRELQASKMSFQKEDLKAGYVTFEPYVGKPAYVCFDEDVASIANIECDWD
ncbi:TPA: hypothetical protein RQL00_003199 [Vibrio vulnificus]|nr:hypothetical protein [Vibrio vulnificus]